jgi:CHAT domain-containing protein/tetratricopeptide (TPR) repeat protein
MLRMQLSLARSDKTRTEPIVAELFKLSSTAGFEARLDTLDDDRKEEALALCGVLEQQALATDKLPLALHYRLHRAYLLLRSDRPQEAVAATTSTLNAALQSEENVCVPRTLIYHSWSLQAAGATGLTTEIFDDTVSRLGSGFVALQTLWLAARKFPLESRYFEQGVVMARALELPLVEAAFLLQRAETDLSQADTYRDQARELVRGLDLRGVGSTWYGDAISNSIHAVGLDTDDDGEIWPRYLELLESGRTEGEISEFWSAMVGGLSDRRAAWVWFEPLLESILERTSDWGKKERASEVFGALHRLRRAWVAPRQSGQSTTFGARDGILGNVLGLRLAEDPALLDGVLDGLAQWSRDNPGEGQTRERYFSLGNLLAALGRYQEAADLFTAANEEMEDSRLLRLRGLGALTYVEQLLGQPSASSHLEELARSDFSSDLGVFDQPWRRATELAWWYLEQNRPVEAERLARAGLKTVRKGWAPHLHRRLGAYEALAFALAAQGRHEEVNALLEQWSQEQGSEGETWLATLKADLLLRAKDAEAAALVAPQPEQVGDLADRIYLANLRRRIGLARGDEQEVARMELSVRTTFQQMVSGSPRLERALLASPAYADLPFLGKANTARPDFAVRGDRDHLEKVIEKLEVLRRREPENEALARLGGAHVRAMAEAAGAGQVMVHPVLLRYSVLLVVASEGRVLLRERFVDSQSLRETMARLCALAASSESSTARWEADSDYISVRLLEPWDSEFPGRRHLLWLADGELEQLPLSLLSLRGQSLLERMSVTCLDGPASLPDSPGDSDALLIGGSDDLSGAAQELEQVRRLLPAGESWRLGDDFARLQRLSQSHPIVHIASHGLPPSATRAGGQLSGTEGSLSAFRLADLEFAPGSLVVASACEVGSETAGGPGDAAVLNAFRTAGAATVIGSPWPIDDQTSRDMSLAFYRHLLAGQGPATALATAQRDVRETHPHPHFWAGTRLLSGPVLRRIR